MRVLQVSTRGCHLGKQFSAFNAKVLYNDKLKSIEEHYQGAKRFNGEQLPSKQAKGKKPTEVNIYGKNYPPSMLTPFYYLLWFKFYIENPDLVNRARAYDDYNDMFKGGSVNCQADTLRLYIRDKARYIEIIKPLVKELENKN